MKYFYALVLLLIQPIFLKSQPTGITLPTKKMMTILSIDYPTVISSNDLKSKINDAVISSIINSCDRLSIRTDYGMNDSNTPIDEKIRLDKEIRDILALSIEERQAVSRENIVSIKERTTSQYLFYSQVYYNANDDSRRYELSYSIVLLDDMTNIVQNSITWASNRISMQDLNLVFDDAFRQLEFCKDTDTGDITLENLRNELRGYASYVISSPNDNETPALIKEYILIDSKHRRLYHTEYEAELTERIKQTIPADNSPLEKSDIGLLKFYYDLLDKFYNMAILQYPTLKKEYSKRLVGIRLQMKALNLR